MCVIIFQLDQSAWPGYIHATGGQTNGQLTAAISYHSTLHYVAISASQRKRTTEKKTHKAVVFYGAFSVFMQRRNY